MSFLIHAIFILDSSGTPIYVWKHSQAPETLFRGKDEILVGSLISALLNFGQETFAAPQRIDFNGFALTFFSGRYRDSVFWTVAVSDSLDHRRATTRMLRDLVESLSNVLEKVSLEEGIVIETESSSGEMNSIIRRTVQKHLRFLPKWRSTPLRSLLLSLIVSIPFGIMYYLILENPISAYYLTTLLGINSYIFGAFIVISATVLIGALGGLIASDLLSGFIAGYFANIMSYIVVSGVSNIINIIALFFSFGLLSALIGGIIGYYIDTVKLKYV